MLIQNSWLREKLARIVEDGLVTNAALDRTCAIPESDLLALVSESAAVPAIPQSSRQKLLMYVGHLRYGLGDRKGAVAALEDAFSALPANPTPLLLAAHWYLDTGELDAARQLYERARAVGGPGRLDLDSQFAEVAERLTYPVPATAVP